MIKKQFRKKINLAFPTRRQAWRWLLPVLLILLFLSTLLWLPWQAQRMEANERQEQLIADTLWVEQTIRFQLARNEENIRLIGNDIMAGYAQDKRLHDRLTTLVRNNRELNRIVWLDKWGNSIATTDGMPALLEDFSVHSKLAAERARVRKAPLYSEPAPPPGLDGPMLMDYHVPLFNGERYIGSLVASYSTASILDEMVPWWFAQDNEITLTDSDDNVINKRSSGGPGRAVYTHRRALDLPGAALTLNTNSVKGEPKLLPSLLVASVIALSLGLVWSLWALWRDINRRLAAEDALRQQVAFRTAMENSLVTGMRARDLEGRITYANPAFCRMVGMRAEDLVGKKPPMPYWAPEAIEEYQERYSKMLVGTVTPNGYETVLQRSNGERFPVLIFESALVDDSGKQTGWMGSILDISDRKRVEELNRQQQEKLQISARLSTMGEIASTLAHELNQPLAAISSYTAGALNLLNDASAKHGVDVDMLKPALEKAGAQAQRAGHIIRSVHAFVKKREPTREMVSITTLIESVMPLVELQAQQFFVAVQTSIVPGLPSVLADRVLLEQVLLNLTRNGIESMQRIAPERRTLRIAAELDHESASQPNVVIAVIDQGHGISAEVAQRLFSPFFSTKAEGMGIGLNICRTAVEFHGGTLTHADNPGGGTIFRFALPALSEAAAGLEMAGKEESRNEDYSAKICQTTRFSL